MRRYGRDEFRNLGDVLQRGVLGDLGGCGPYNRRFEGLLAARLDVPYALTLVSGTAGLHTSLLAVGVGPGDEVIVDPLIKFGAVAALHANALPVFADVDPDDFLLSPESVARRITPRTKAIICTALFGLPVDTDAILVLARPHRIKVIEDCAQAFLARRGGRFAGTVADVGVFSFQMNKHLSTGEGGALVTSDVSIYREAEAIRDHGRRPGEPSHRAGLGWMYRMTELSAAVGVAQLAKIRRFIARHRRVARVLSEAVSEARWIRPQRVTAGSRHVYWTWAARVAEPSLCDRFAAELRGVASDCEVGYCPAGPIYRRPLFEGRPYRAGDESRCPIAERLIDSMIHIRIDVRKPFTYYLDQARLLRDAARRIGVAPTTDAIPEET
jgi:dTDP-4-amino-4,6-dideoxygalactose transaminase